MRPNATHCVFHAFEKKKYNGNVKFDKPLLILPASAVTQSALFYGVNVAS